MSLPQKSSRKFLLAAAALLVLVAALALLLFHFASPAKFSPAAEAPSTGVAVTNPAPKPPRSRLDARSLDEWLQRVTAASPAQLGALMREAMQISDPDARQRVVGALAVRWINADLPGFIAFMDETEAAEEGGDSFWTILAPALFASLPAVDDAAASSNELREVILRLINFYAGVDPRAALAWARQWMLDDTLDASLAAIAPELARSDPKAADAVLATIRQPLSRIEAVAGIAEVRARENPAAAIAWSQALAAPAERPYAMQSVLSELASTRPDWAAKEYASYRGALEAEFAAQVAADRTALGLDAESARNIDLNDPASAAERRADTAAPAHSVGVEILTRAAPAIASQLAATDPAGAISWVERLPDGGSKIDALAAALAIWAETAPRQALAAYESKSAGNPAPVEGIFNSWAARDPAVAAKEAVAFEGGDPQRESAVRGVVSGWVEQSGESEAAAWVDSLPPGRLRDAAAMEFVNATSGEQPFTAWGRASVIQEPAQRLRSMKKALSAMLIQDPGQARSTLAAARLPETDRQDLDRLVAAVLPPEKRR